MEKNNNIEFWIFDKELINAAKENNLKNLEQIKRLHPEQSDVIENAFILLQSLKVKEVSVSDLKIERSLKGVWGKIERKKNKKRIYWISSACAACACIVLVISSLLMAGQDYVHNKQEAFALLDSIENFTDEIQIISGTSKTYIPNGNIITQTAEGDMVVGAANKIRYTDLEEGLIQMIVPEGKRATIKFNDGTVAWLNSGSKLLYPKTFSGKRRDIYLEGETYLEVGKDKSRPFHVHTKGFEVSVLGTKFNVRAYNDDLEKSVVLVEGSVAVDSDNGKQHKLSPNEGYFSGQGIAKIKKVDTYAYTCWKDGIMQIHNESLEVIFTRLERYYGVNINCDDSISSRKYIGNLNLHDSLSEVLHSLLLSTSYTFDYNKETKIVKIHHKK